MYFFILRLSCCVRAIDHSSFVHISGIKKGIRKRKKIRWVRLDLGETSNPDISPVKKTILFFN